MTSIRFKNDIIGRGQFFGLALPFGSGMPRGMLHYKIFMTVPALNLLETNC